MAQNDVKEATIKTVIDVVAEREKKRHDWIEDYLNRNLNIYTKK
ncbi:hypothetical protein [Companilactobacillus bobalius]|uniref:Uncharacterized protein n=1 Tax=Companilactobacillus bobalius TaxID=2801451 RepID=A0A202FE54_9LACO|nr:hypothetical protein [Companilactobacillus bobalius]OVE98733.1 hypothetical protein LKACC16343_00895 [Companilactobacillus bobalius]GEO57908.1 hypothetical protein LBO01_10370 [Companilactobacillus paralimentarius]